ncbi:MAG: hypothetical protein CFE31_05355 [Rhizobiales bacterium PAR1]|nr:MAG: hypothetical protein CFE31_05355 [Rhizobiales bacterium PAR1]
MKTIYAATFAAATLLSTAAFASAESSQNGVLVTATTPAAVETYSGSVDGFQALGTQSSGHMSMTRHATGSTQSSNDPAVNANLGK